MTTLVLADDHPLVLEGLELLLGGVRDFEVVATCADGYEALAAARRHRPDILVLDLRMPALSGIELLRRLRHEALPTRVVVLTAGLWERELVQAVRLGAWGVVLKESTSRVLVDCLRAVARGEHRVDVAGLADQAALPATGGDEEVLTEREVEIVRLLAQGFRNREIATRLHITEGTVKVHLHHVYQKLGLEGRLALVRWADDRGLA